MATTMKELSIEQKAKRYDEAIEELRGLLESIHEEKCDIMEEDIIKIFPELKESEDKKIKEWLIRLINTAGYRELDTDKMPCSRTNVIAWLEKQDESIKLSEEEQNRFAKGVLTRCALSFIDYLDAHKYESKMCVSNGECKDIENAFHNAMWDRLHRYYCKYIEKQGEQKPNGQRQECADCQFNYAGECKGYCAMKRGEQKPAWGEEDGKMINKLLAVVNLYYDRSGNDLDKQSCISFLKSLKDRYTWKPSDEQMITLHHVISGCSYDIEPLVELETKLKEL